MNSKRVRYSRHERTQRKLESAAEGCFKIMDYVQILSEMEVLLRQNQELQEKLVPSMTGPSQSSQNADLSSFLKLLLECAASNAKKKTNGYRYSDTIKELALLLYSMGNLQIYEFLTANLPLPSISTVRKLIYSNDVIVEGKFMIKEFKLFLSERNYPFSVQCCEDATVVVKQLQYHAASNQIVGNVLPLDQNGLPIPNSYPATSAQVISEYFKKEVSPYLYCIMAQPLLHNSAPFCIAIFGTNQKFTAAQVHTRWMWTVQALLEEGIVVVSFSSDGDSRLMKTMRHNAILPSPNPTWPWFQAELKPPFMCIQDHIHVGVKLKSRLLKPCIILPMGPFKTVSRGHLVELITQTQTRDQHLLCLSDINPRDKMNFKAVQMSDPRVSSLLTKEVKDSEATSTYLEMMCQVVESFTRVDLSPLERVEMIWEWVFFVRMWKSLMLDTEGYTIKNNFISFNSYYCIELNAHALIQCIIWFRDREEHASFLPWLLSSQVCEGTFRKLWSPKLTGSGVTCFTVQEAKNFFRRLDLSLPTQNSLESVVKFPRHHKHTKPSEAAPHIPVCLPENYDIKETIKVAFNKAVVRAMAFKLIKSRPKSIVSATLQSVTKSDMDLQISDDEDEDCDLENVTDLESDNENNESGSELDEDNEPNDVIEDLFVASAGPIHLKTYEVANLTETSPFVQVADNNGITSIVKKSTLCWLLRSKESKIVSDRLQRVQNGKSAIKMSSSFTHLSHPSQEDFVSVGDWCAFKFEDGSIGVGRILAFSYLSGRSLKHQEYSQLDAPTTPPPKNARGVGCLCTWFTIHKNKLTVTQMDLHGYYDLKKYVCTIPRPKVDGKKLLMACTLSQIKHFCKKVWFH